MPSSACYLQGSLSPADPLARIPRAGHEDGPTKFRPGLQRHRKGGLIVRAGSRRTGLFTFQPCPLDQAQPATGLDEQFTESPHQRVNVVRRVTRPAPIKIAGEGDI